MTQGRLLIISPVRNEAAHIACVVRAVAEQTTRPALWVIIDDGSTDATLAVLHEETRDLPFVRVLSAPPQQETGVVRDRLARAAAPRNFNAGLATVDWRSYTHIMKLDGDIQLPPDYLRTILQRFAAEPTLGIAGGVLIEPVSSGGVRPLRIPRHHVHGALKIYSRACFEAIGGLDERLGWDTIDETYARMRGFTTMSFADLVSVHHRAWGTADGALRGRMRLGQSAYILHYTLPWVILRSCKLAFGHPWIWGPAYLYGYLRAAVRRVERVPDRDYRRFTRRELRRRMLRAVVSRHPRGDSVAALPTHPLNAVAATATIHQPSC